jgi:signal transduction histidine kinase
MGTSNLCTVSLYAWVSIVSLPIPAPMSALATVMPPGAPGHPQAAVEEERRRWARELHDDTLQNLAALRLSLCAARRAGQMETMGAAVDDAIVQLQREIVNLRSLITDLRPAALDELGMEVAITSLAQRATRHGLEVDVSIELAPRCDPDPIGRRFELDTAIYRIVQEALTNASKHGRAKRASVEIRETGQAVHIVIRDDGDGFDPTAASMGFGLLGMRERVELFDGKLAVRSVPGRGSAIRATLLTAPRSGPAPAAARI